MKVADFFCGAGGFSEGFRQAGFDIVFALDKWLPAIDTHHANHPKAKTILADIEKVAFLPDDEFESLIPDTEIIIGSPPCVAFSNSNKSGKGDKSLGLRLLTSYLRIVARKKFKKNSILKYWILENVPNIKKYIKPFYLASDLHMEGDFKLSVLNDSSGEYNAKFFGVASNRLRFLCGEFPIPQKVIHNEVDVNTLKDILRKLGNPYHNTSENIIDPNYCFSMKSEDVTDFHYVCELADFEWKKAKRLKEDKGYMGKMSFPENIEKPARTIMATMSSSSRESMIFDFKEKGYRLPTVREVASIMSFPIDYRFYGKSKGIKYRLVGNAVPPKLSFALAKAIAQKEKINIITDYFPIRHDEKISFYNLNFKRFPLNKEKPKRPTARFKYHIPYMIIDSYRVELTNYKSNFKKLKFKWITEIHKSQGKNAKVFTPNLDLDILPDNLNLKVCEFLDKIKLSIKSHNEFQNIFRLTDEDRQGMVGPYELLDLVKEFIENNIDDNERKKYVFFNEIPTKLPLAIVVGYIILKKLTEYMGRGKFERAIENSEVK